MHQRPSKIRKPKPVRVNKGPTHSFVVEPLMQSEEVLKIKMSFSKRAAPVTTKKYSKPLNRLQYHHYPNLNDTTEFIHAEVESP